MLINFSSNFLFDMLNSSGHWDLSRVFLVLLGLAVCFLSCLVTFVSYPLGLSASVENPSVELEEDS